VEVRRSSDGEEDSFTASDVADGTLEDWVSEAPIAQNSTSNPYSTFTNASATGFTATLSSGVAYAGFGGVSGSSGDSVTVSFDLDIVSGSPFLALREGTGLINSKSNSQVYSSSGSYSLTMTATGDFGFIGFSEGDIPSEFTVSNFEITSVSGATYVRDGFVSKWYDQSGNTKHATQAVDASQPQIVDGGSLVLKGANSEPSIFFGTTADKHLDVTGRPIAQSVFSILQSGNNNFETLICDTVDSSPRITTNNAVNNRVYRFLGLGAPSVNVNGVTYNGTSSVFSLGFHLLGLTSGTGSEINRIGANPSTGATQNSFDFVSELILYPDNQSTNRTALEANIGETYGIDLPSGVDTGYDQVDGFVETWYDQSGNGNDAVQQVSGSQPKIVDAGVFLGQVDFLNGVSTFLETNNSDLANLSELSLFSVLEPVTASTNEFAISAGSIVNSTGNYGGWALWANGYSDRFDFTTQARGSGTNSRAEVNITGTSPVVYSATLNGTNAQASVNGVLGTENTSMITPYNSDATRRKLRLGCQYTFAPASFYRGAMKEAILYPSDESANRVAIETDINDHYDIYA